MVEHSVTSRKKGRRIETIKSVTMAPTWEPEYLHHVCREGIQPEPHTDELEVALLPRKAKLYLSKDNWGECDDRQHTKRAPTPIRNLPTANLFLAEVKINMEKLPELVHSVASLEIETCSFLKSARIYYVLAREPA